MTDMLRINDMSICITSTYRDIVNKFMQSGWTIKRNVKVDNCRHILIDLGDYLSANLFIDLDDKISILTIRSNDKPLLESVESICLCGIDEDKLVSDIKSCNPTYTASWLDESKVRRKRFVWKVNEMMCSVSLSDGVIDCLSIIGNSFEAEPPHAVVCNKKPLCLGKTAPFKIPENQNVSVNTDSCRTIIGMRCFNFGVDDNYNIPTLAEGISMSKVLGNWYHASTPNGNCIKIESAKYETSLYFKDCNNLESIEMKVVI